ncbi:MAG: hypothetical protein ACRDYA_19245 [Egibacteraceae bacterium]
MPDYELLAHECPPGTDCPKVARSATGTVVIVGAQITDLAALTALGVGPSEAAVEITEALYQAGYDGLAREDGGAA